MSHFRRTFTVAIAIGVILVTASSVAVPGIASATTASQSCLTVFNQEVPVAITLAPGETMNFTRNASCPTAGANYLFGIRAAGARTGSVPATAGTTEYSSDGVSWTSTTTENYGWNPPLTVRYTAPSSGATSDSFYLISAGYGGGSAGYLYTVTIVSDVTPPAPVVENPRNTTVWQLAVGRTSEVDACPEGFGGSWAGWPNGGTGGWVCVRNVWAYDPEGRPSP